VDASDVIDSYVHDVARRLPSRRRDDVAFEMRALLGEDLRTRGAAEGREPDADLALRLVRSLGRPSERRPATTRRSSWSTRATPGASARTAPPPGRGGGFACWC